MYFFCGSFMLFLSCVCICFHVGLFIVALWSPIGKGLTSWLLFVVSVNCHFPIVILGQVWYLIIWIPDLCTLTYFVSSGGSRGG